MEILKYFDKSIENGISIYRFKSACLNDFQAEITTSFRNGYIDDNDLEVLSKKNNMPKSIFLEKYVLPDVGNIKSGDFGEMLSFFSMLENYLQKGLKFSGPNKWLWKDRNKASQYTDAVSFYIKNTSGPSIDDTIVSIESKMKAIQSNRHRIQDAIDGANEDRLTRLVKTLAWLEEKYAKLGDITNRKIVERFRNPSEFGTYKKIFKAFTILDETFLDEEIDFELENVNDLLIIVFSFNDLKGIYEQNRKNIIKSVVK